MKQVEKDALIDAWYRLYYKQLLYYARSSLDESLAEEVVQETFYIVCTKDTLEEIEVPAIWLRRILSNVMRNRERETRTWRTLCYSMDVLPEHAMGSYENKEDLDLLYGNLTSKDSFYLLKRIAVDRCTYMEVGEEWGISAEACRKRVKRSAEELKKKIKVFL